MLMKRTVCLFLLSIFLYPYLAISQKDSVSAKVKSGARDVDSVKYYIDTIKKDDPGLHFQSPTGLPISTVNEPIVIQPKKPELFNSGFIDFQNSGQVNASARVFRLYIGEPKKFMLPVSVYSGVSGNNFNSGYGNSRGSETLVLGLINPMSGLFNFSIENIHRIGHMDKLTGISFVYQAGEKLISGQQAITLKPFSFFSSFAYTGILFQTGAWEKEKEKNMGVFWILLRYHVVRTGNSFERLSGYPPDKNYFRGISLGSGIEINNVLNIKTYYYRYIRPGAENFTLPIYQLTFNYSMRSNW